MTVVSALEKLRELNDSWKKQDYTHVVENESKLTIVCPSCSLSTEDAHASLVSALNKALCHRLKCQASSRS